MPPNKKIKLSLERPWKDDAEQPIPVLYDITPDGEHIYEPKETSAQVLSKNIQRIFLERGIDFFDKYSQHVDQDKEQPDETSPNDSKREPSEEVSDDTMTEESLFKMRVNTIPQIYVALGEMTQGMELISSLLASAPVQTRQTPGASLLQQIASKSTLPLSQQPSTSLRSVLSATNIKRGPSIPSVGAFNAQLALGSKDKTLRKAADVFKSAANRMEKTRLDGQKYWLDALKLRRANWSLLPMPLSYGATNVRISDKLSKDFLISYGLEESPAAFKRAAIAHMPNYGKEEALLFPNRSHTRLRIYLTSTDSSGQHEYSQSAVSKKIEDNHESSLFDAQLEIVDQEVFSLLVKEAGTLPTASARVSERLIVIDATEGLELKFELVDDQSLNLTDLDCSGPIGEQCDLIYFSLRALLLRQHSATKLRRLGSSTIPSGQQQSNAESTTPSLVLQPIIDLLQFQAFCQRVNVELNVVIVELRSAGIVSTLRFEPVGDLGQRLVHLFDESRNRTLSGQAILRVEHRQTIRFTFLSPSTLTAHLPQATMTVTSIPQLRQLLLDENERLILSRICDLGGCLCKEVDGTWFVDSNRCVGRWEGCVLNFRVVYTDDGINCTAYELDHGKTKHTQFLSYAMHRQIPLFSWVTDVITAALANT